MSCRKTGREWKEEKTEGTFLKNINQAKEYK
jgi:hypothetical protein